VKAVAIGTAAYKPEYQDIDLVCDHEYIKFLLREWPARKKAGSTGNVFLFERSVPIEVTVPHAGTAMHLLLQHERKRGLSLEIDGRMLHVEAAYNSELCALKKAHLISPHNWKKHMEEYKLLKDQLDVGVFNYFMWGDHVKQLFKLHRKEVLAFAKPHPKLNTMKDEFFEEASFKIFDHDSIHKAIALEDEPAYTLMQDGEVWCSKKKWKAMSERERLRCVIEEASVLALERSIIPSIYLGEPFRGAKWAYEYALYKICTTITSGWFRDYCIERYWDAKKVRPDYVNAFFEGLKSGVVKVLKPEVVKA
jgi:hypothetical protein